MSQLCENLSGVKVSMDDIIVYAKTRAEHDRRLHKVLQVIREAGVKLNLNKCQIGQPELTFLGEKLTGEGVCPDPKKVEAIKKMPDPESKEDLKRALGMVSYLAKFIPNMSVKTTNLRKLLLQDAEWKWTQEQSKDLGLCCDP